MKIEEFDKESLARLDWLMFQSYDPWADMMYLGGAGDEGSTVFPLDLDEIESIDIGLVRSEGSPES